MDQKNDLIPEALGGAVHFCTPPGSKNFGFRVPWGRVGRGKPEVALTRQETPKGVGGLKGSEL